MSKLSPEQASRAADFMVDALRSRHPNIGDTALALFAARAREWEAASCWEGEGLIVLTHAAPTRWGPAEAVLHVLCDDTPESWRWVQATVPHVKQALPASASCRVPWARRELLEHLGPLGFGVSKVGLGGRVETMRERLSTLPIVAPEERGLALAALTLDRIEEANALRRDYFTAHPEHGWASGTLEPERQRAIDEREVAETTRRVTEGLGLDFVLLEAGRLVGSFGMTRPAESAVSGRTASFNICISPHWHGQGLGLLAYDVMTSRAAELGLEYLAGSTSNPAVLRLGARLGREIDNFLLRRTPPWLASEQLLQKELHPD